MQKKKIALVANTAWYVQTFKMGHLKALRNAGYEVVAFATEDSNAEEIKAQGFEFVPIKKLSRKGTNPLVDLLLVWELFRAYRKHKIDIALCFTIKPNIYGTYAAKLAGIKSICTVTGLGYVFYYDSFANSIGRFLYRIAYLMSDGFYLLNKYDYNLFFRRMVSPGEKSGVIYGSGIDTAHFTPDFCKHLRLPDHKGITFIMIARLLIDKGTYEYAEAARIVKQQYPESTFILLGDFDPNSHEGVEKTDLETWVKEGIIVYKGYMKELRPEICQADAVVLPSWREGISRVLLEGLAMGKPCITTDAPGCNETVFHEETGLLCEVKNPRSLADACIRMIEMSPEQRQIMGENARKRALDTFATEIITEKYLQMVKKL